jgi:hypothetical protein
LEPCWSSYQCKSYLSCREGVCQCNQSDYHAVDSCKTRVSINQKCSADNCLFDSNLVCSQTTGFCECPSTR